MRICLAIGDRQVETFIKDSLQKLVCSVTEQGLSVVDPRIKDVYSRGDLDDAQKKIQREEILLEYFGGHKFLSKLSLKMLWRVQDSGVTSVEFVDEAPYRECVVERCSKLGVDVLILSESLSGQTHFQTLCQDVKVHCPNTRIIVIGGVHEKGDDFLTSLIQKTIFDITYGSELKCVELFKLIFSPNNYGDGLKYLSNSQITEESRESDASSGATLNMEPVESVDTKEHKLFGGKKKKDPIITSQPQPSTSPFRAEPTVQPRESAASSQTETQAVSKSKGTDLFEEPKVKSAGAGTELFMDGMCGEKDGLTCYPYDMKPLLVTNRITRESFVINPDGSRENRGNLPAVIKTPRDKAYELYISTLITDGENQGIMKDAATPPTHQQMTYGVKAKSMLFTSSIQGVGCSTMAFNMACLIANDRKKRVLFIDTNFGESSSYARLEIPMDIGIGLDDLMLDPSREKDILSKQDLLNYARGRDINRFSCFPDTLSYITWSKEAATKLPWIVEHLDMFTDMLNRLSYSFDFIVFDSTLIVSNEIYEELFQFANLIIPVVTQDIYSTNKTANQLHLYDKFNISAKTKVLLNRYVSAPPLTAEAFSGDFYNSRVYTMFDDNEGFIRAQAQGIPYVVSKNARRKFIKTMRFFLTECGV